MGAINGLFRFNYSNYGKLVGEELNKAIDKIPEGFILRDLITESYTSPSINEMSKITGIPSDKLIYYGPDMLQDLALKFPKLKEIVLDVKDTMKSVGSYGVPLTVGGSATLYNQNK